jgi:hypothetical protein
LNPINYYNPFLEKQIFLSAKKIIAVSTKVKDEILRYYGHQLEKKINVIPNGINIRKFNHEKKNEYRIQERVRLNFKENDFVIGFASSNFKLKGLEHLIKALKHLDARKKLVAQGWTLELTIPDVVTHNTPQIYTAINAKNNKVLSTAKATAYFYRPLEMKHDFSLPMQVNDQGAYQVSVNLPLKGRWDLVVEITKGDFLQQASARMFAQ